MDDAEAEEATFWGLPPDALSDRHDDDAGIWPEHVAAVEAFLAIGDQWRVLQVTGPDGAPMMRVRGLDPVAAEARLRLAGIEMTPQLWAEVQGIEQGAIAALNGD
ncbi:DUF1799 domain-containing protein [Sagittula sp. S175]|uniref:DUF1799 domain-containing protein n=1 Tax=Sagittula sp. S175 TaxID=3415129 RepID=UPI003C7A0613